MAPLGGALAGGDNETQAVGAAYACFKFSITAYSRIPLEVPTLPHSEQDEEKVVEAAVWLEWGGVKDS